MNGMEWNKMEWDAGMEWNGIEWNGMLECWNGRMLEWNAGVECWLECWLWLLLDEC